MVVCDQSCYVVGNDWIHIDLGDKNTWSLIFAEQSLALTPPNRILEAVLCHLKRELHQIQMNKLWNCWNFRGIRVDGLPQNINIKYSLSKMSFYLPADLTNLMILSDTGSLNYK